jgi:hypothetical protein
MKPSFSHMSHIQCSLCLRFLLGAMDLNTEPRKIQCKKKKKKEKKKKEEEEVKLSL